MYCKKCYGAGYLEQFSFYMPCSRCGGSVMISGPRNKKYVNALEVKMLGKIHKLSIDEQNEITNNRKALIEKNKIKYNCWYVLGETIKQEKL